MSNLIGAIIRALVVLWVIDAYLGMTDPDYKAKQLRERIDLLRKWNQKIGEQVIELEAKYAELVA